MNKEGAEGYSSGVARDLVDLASERSSEKRVELLRRITNVYADQINERNTTEQYLFDELVSKLIDKISPADRAEASSHLSKLPKIQPALAQQLANDRDINVAGPIVRNYAGLPEKVLIGVAKTGSQDHLRAIAGRSVLTPPVTDVVVHRGDQSTVRTLAANQGAKFSSAGMRVLVQKANKDEALQALVVERTDLSFEAIGNLLSMISQGLADRLRGKTLELDKSVVVEHLIEWMDDRQQNVERTDAYITAIRQGDLKLVDVAMELIEARRLLDAVTILAVGIDIDRDCVFSQLTRGRTDSVLLLLKSASMPWVVVDAFLKLRRSKGMAPYDPFLDPQRRRIAIELPRDRSRGGSARGSVYEGTARRHGR